MTAIYILVFLSPAILLVAFFVYQMHLINTYEDPRHVSQEELELAIANYEKVCKESWSEFDKIMEDVNAFIKKAGE